jgi:hypothetical protein
MTTTRVFFLASMIALASAAGGAAAADSYPVTGRWTYADASASGPAPDCKKPTMEFRGAQRLDSGSGVPAYRNVRVEQSSPTLYRVVDEFFNVQARGRVSYTLRIRDEDHLQIDYDQGGKSVALRRCG